MALSKVAPLAWNAPIVDEHGNPTPYFQRQLARLLEEKAATDALAEGAVPNTTSVLAGTGLSGGGALTSDVTLNVDTAAEAERIRDTIGTALVAGTNITITVNDGSDTITIAASGGSSGGTSYEAGPITPPTTTGLATWDNQGTSTATDGTGAMILKPQGNNTPAGRYKTAPATPYDIYCRVEINTLKTTGLGTANEAGAGILFKDTGGDNERLLFCIIERYDTSGGDDTILYELSIERWSGASPPVFSAHAIGLLYGSHPYRWLRVNNDGTTLTFYAGFDGKNWHQVGTETLAAYIDGAASYGVAAYTSSHPAIAQFSYFSTTAPS